MGWGKPNLVCSAKEKMLKAILKDEMIGQIKIQAIKLGHAQDLNWMWWQFKDNFKIMLENECLCMLSKKLS